ncbi:MAG: amidohydrolase family protein, partial [Verrucomicrobia bacterium]|nr:amidohydrolase family protein [Verrucomicrobiota bacterium]
SFTLDTTPKERMGNPEDWKSPEDQDRERSRKLRELDDFFDSAAAYGKARSAAGGSNGLQTVPAWEATLPVLRGEVPVFLHANEYRQIRSAVEWAARRKLRCVLAGGRDAARLADLLATHRVAVAYEHVFTLPPREVDPYDVQFTTPAALHRAGVKVTFSEGTERFGASTVRNIPYAAAQAVAFGLPPAEALRGLTLYPAQLLGVADRLGSLEPGKDATFVVANGDLLDLRTQVVRLWIAGVEVPVESRHTRLYERYRARPKP